MGAAWCSWLRSWAPNLRVVSSSPTWTRASPIVPAYLAVNRDLALAGVQKGAVTSFPH